MTQKAFDLALLVPDKDPVVGDVIRVKDPGDDFTTEFFIPVASIPNATAPGQTIVSDGANNWIAALPGAANIPYATSNEVVLGVETLKALNPKVLADAATWRRTNPADATEDGRKYVRLAADGYLDEMFLRNVAAVNNFDATRSYVVGQFVVQGGALYVATAPTAAGAFNPAQWRNVSAPYVLPVATSTTLGGVKATTPVAGQFVSGIAANGDLIFGVAPQGVKGDKGDQGVQGVAGVAATVAVGTVTTGAAGSTATVVNSGTTAAATLDFTIPRGDKGDKGDKGDTGNTGAAATVAIGTVTTAAAGASATVTNSGTTAAAVFDFAIPQGAKGDKGDKGDAGATYTLPAATAGALGGVKATARPTGKFVTGVNASGDLTFDFLPPAAATQLGGVFATANPGNQFVTGIAADGSLTFAAASFSYTLPAATNVALGGIKLAARPADQFVTGFAADGTTQYSALPDVPVATAAKAGGVKATANPGSQYVIGINTTGDLVYGALPALTAATATVVGGVKATANPGAGNFVTGVNGTGDLTFSDIIDVGTYS